MNNHIFLKGSLASLNLTTIKDINLIYSWFNSKEITEKINKGYFPNTYIDQLKITKKIIKSENDIQLSVRLLSNNNIVGIVGLHKINWIHRTAEIGIIIDKENSIKGVGTEVISLIKNHSFKKLNLRKLKAGFWSNNIPSKKIFIKNGFKFEYKSLKEFYYKSKYIDSIHYSIFKK